MEPGPIVQVPSEVAEDLVSQGHALSGHLAELRESRGAGGEVLNWALITYNTVGTTVTLVAGWDHVAALARSLVKWRKRASPPKTGKPYTLKAGGPGGGLEFELEEKPDIEAVTAFLERHIWRRPRR
jgi:hypothetical protein